MDNLSLNNSLLGIGGGGFNMPSFAKNFQMNGINISDYANINKLDNVNQLQGNVELNLHSNIDSIKDKELLSDINTLMNQQNNQPAGMNGVSSADKLYDSFAKALEDGVNNLNNTQRDAERKIETFATGGNIDIHTVMIAAEKSNLSMQLAMQLRTKLVTAYKEISHLQI